MENNLEAISKNGQRVAIPEEIAEVIKNTTSHVLMIAPPKCVQCDATIRAFEKKNISFSKFIVEPDREKDQNPELTDRIRQFMVSVGDGGLSLPFVIDLTRENLDHNWGGFNPLEIGAIQAEALAS